MYQINRPTSLTPTGQDNCRSIKPASRRAAVEKGGVLTTPWSHTKGLSFGLIELLYVGYDILQGAA